MVWISRGWCSSSRKRHREVRGGACGSGALNFSNEKPLSTQRTQSCYLILSKTSTYFHKKLICGASAKPKASSYYFARQRCTGEFNNELTANSIRTHDYTSAIICSLFFISLAEDDSGLMTITMLGADTREYSTTRASAAVAVTSSPADIQLTTKGSAPTTPEWTLTAIGAIINPAISNGAPRFES
ncbi:MAG: hypothetical protein KKG76_06280 [Euryarchaeota archaeon]|nr:hypothetical protein [Euryarchaeota archaeon]